ncbi:platelet-derived growth factor C [Sardina pilchardus]|uniref:platelet-derived growth factor C n=1 Tax=Sardina pilchardus TaxID=27697 RepID=UPI002E115D07
MIQLLLVLLASSLQQHGVGAESSHISKFHQSAAKEQNGVQESQHEKVIRVSEGGEGELRSPNFPHVYPRSAQQVWRLLAANENARIQLTFDQRFGLEDPEDGMCKYDYVEVEDPVSGVVLGRWCGQSAPGPQVSPGNQLRVHFTSDEYFPSEPGFTIRYKLLPQQAPSPVEVPVVAVEVLSEAVSQLQTVEEVLRYLEPERWPQDMEELYTPTWHLLGKAFIQPRKSRGVVDLNLLREEVRLYSCTPRNFSVSLREELRRTDAIFWPGCLLVQRCGGNCACCAHRCHDCQCQPTRVAKKYHEVLMMRHRPGSRGLQKTLTDVALEHHEECSCVCTDDSD